MILTDNGRWGYWYSREHDHLFVTTVVIVKSSSVIPVGDYK